MSRLHHDPRQGALDLFAPPPLFATAAAAPPLTRPPAPPPAAIAPPQLARQYLPPRIGTALYADDPGLLERVAEINGTNWGKVEPGPLEAPAAKLLDQAQEAMRFDAATRQRVVTLAEIIKRLAFLPPAEPRLEIGRIHIAEALSYIEAFDGDDAPEREPEPEPEAEADQAAAVEQFEADRRSRAERDRAAWETEKAAIAAAEVANTPETLCWGKRAAGGYGGKYLEIGLLQDGNRWRVRCDLSMPNMGSFRGFGRAEHATRDEALVATLRRQLKGIARHLTGGSGSVFHGTEADWLAMARWCVEQAPSALFGGPDLAAEFDAMRATYAERNEFRCKAICAGKQYYIDEAGERRPVTSL